MELPKFLIQKNSILLKSFKEMRRETRFPSDVFVEKISGLDLGRRVSREEKMQEIS